MKALLFLVSLAMVLFSCQKEISADFLNTTPNGLLGHWNFVNSHLTSRVTVEINEDFYDVKTITLADYSTLNNAGQVVIDDSTITSSGIAYDINTTVKAYTYENGNIDDSTDFPFSFTLPAAGSRTAYTLVGNDSVSLSGSGFDQLSNTPAGYLTGQMGYHYELNGDTLKLTSPIANYAVDSSFGTPVQTWSDIKVVTTLSRQ